jgi:hypothetical protein
MGRGKQGWLHQVQLQVNPSDERITMETTLEIKIHGRADTIRNHGELI